MTRWVPPQTLDPTRVKAVITTRWSGTAYKSATIRRVESYSVSSHLDSDADPWQLEIGNPDKDLNPTLARDNEVRVQVFGAGSTGNVPILSGITDDATYTEQGSLLLSGRDMSCIAVDSDHFPNIYRGMSPTKIIEMEAKAIKCATKFQITPIVGGPLRQQTDGSEKFWEFWYRMVRKDGMWIWMLADGTLVVSKLNYNDAPVYHFASATVKNSSNGAIMVESVNWHKTTQTRIGKLGVEWRTQSVSLAGKPTVTVYEDVTNKDWLKRPNKIIQDKHATSKQSAYKVAVEELFETRVGAIEITLTVQDPGFMIRQNRMALVEIPELGIKGNWFVVGSTMRGDSNGFLQEVRLREKKFAISKRVPDDPVWTKDPTNTTAGGGEPSGKAASDIFGQMNNHADWWDCYLSAAQKWRGLYDLALFMATLLAITDHETGFTNERSNDANDGSGNTFPAPGEHNLEWFDIRAKNPSTQELDDWHRNFANDGPDSYLPAGYHCAVGPMQIFDKSLKEEADQLGGGSINEFYGNRWVPCDSIMVAAHKLNTVARTTNGSQADLWAGVCRYGGYSNPDCPYGKDIENRVLNSPGWLQLVVSALNSVAPATGGQGDLPPGGGCNMEAAGWANKVLAYCQSGKIKIAHSEDLDDIQRAAQGLKTKKYGVCIDARVMATMVAIADKWGSMRTYAISSGHSDDSSGWGGHARGFAFDLNEAGGVAFDGSYSLLAKQRDIDVLTWLHSYGAPDVRLIATNVGNAPVCDPDITSFCIPSFSRWGVTCESHSNHIHVCYTPGVPS